MFLGMVLFINVGCVCIYVIFDEFFYNRVEVDDDLIGLYLVYLWLLLVLGMF